MPHTDPEKRKAYQRNLMRERRAGAKPRAVKITVGELPELAASEEAFHQGQLVVAARMQALARAALESMTEISPRQVLEFLDQSAKMRAESMAALAALNTKEEPEEGGFGSFGIKLKQLLSDEGFTEMALGLLTYAPPTDAPERTPPAPRAKRKAPAKPKGSAAKKPEPGPDKKAPKGRAKT